MAVLWVRPQGLLGNARDALGLARARARRCSLYPGLVAGTDSAAFLQDMGALVLLAAIGASAWNIVGGYAGQISVGHAMFFGAGAYLPLLLYHAMAAAAARSACRSASP